MGHLQLSTTKQSKKTKWSKLNLETFGVQPKTTHNNGKKKKNKKKKKKQEKIKPLSIKVKLSDCCNIKFHKNYIAYIIHLFECHSNDFSLPTELIFYVARFIVDVDIPHKWLLQVSDRSPNEQYRFTMSVRRIINKRLVRPLIIPMCIQGSLSSELDSNEKSITSLTLGEYFERILDHIVPSGIKIPTVIRSEIFKKLFPKPKCDLQHCLHLLLVKKRLRKFMMVDIKPSLKFVILSEAPLHYYRYCSACDGQVFNDDKCHKCNERYRSHYTYVGTGRISRNYGWLNEDDDDEDFYSDPYAPPQECEYYEYPERCNDDYNECEDFEYQDQFYPGDEELEDD